MTVFLSLTMTIMLLLVFTLLEGTRIAAGRASAKIGDELALENVFAEYDRSLFERYRLLFLYGSYGREDFQVEDVTERMKEYLREEDAKNDFLSSETLQISATSLQLATDGEGAMYLEQAALAEKYLLGEQGLTKIVEFASNGLETEVEPPDTEELLAEASSSVSNAAPAEDPSQVYTSSVSKEEADGIFSFLKMLRRKGVLALVTDPAESVSDKGIADTYSSRKDLVKGNEETEFEASAETRLLFWEYLLTEFGCFGDLKEDTALDYEVEYILCGHLSDAENLKAVVNRILLLRTGVNFLYLQGDAEKIGCAESVAIGLAGFTGNPALIELVKQALLGGWAYAESVAEVKQLLHGGRIPLVKSAGNWNTDLFHLAQSIEGGKKQKEGMSYHDYLRAFLMVEGIKLSCMRSLDLIEKNLQKEEFHEHFRIDYCINAMTVSVERRMPSMFVSLTELGNYQFSILDTLSYQYE